MNTILKVGMLMSKQVCIQMHIRTLTQYGLVATILIFTMVINIVRADSANLSEANSANSLETQVTSVVREFRLALENGNRERVHGELVVK